MTTRYETAQLPTDSCCVAAHDIVLDRNVQLFVRPAAPLTDRIADRQDVQRRADAGELPAVLDAADLHGRSYSAFTAGTVALVDGRLERALPGAVTSGPAGVTSALPWQALPVTGLPHRTEPASATVPSHTATGTRSRRGRAALVLTAAVAAVAGGSAFLTYDQQPATALAAPAAASMALPAAPTRPAVHRSVAANRPALSTPVEVIAYLALRPSVAGPQAHDVLGCMRFLLWRTHAEQRSEAREILGRLPTWAADGGLRADVAQAARTIALETVAGRRYWT